MSIKVHAFDGRVGREVHATLTHDAPGPAGKAGARTDTYRGTVTEIVPDERVVEVDVFETEDASLAGEMTSTITLADEPGGTLLTAVHDGLPDGVPPSDNERGWAEALDRLADLVEADG